MSAIAEAKNEWGTKSAQCGAIRRPFRANWPLMDAPCLLKPEQVPARHEEVCQRGDDEQPIAVLLQSAVTHLGEAEDALDDQEGMLDLGAHPRPGPILLTLPLGQRLVTAALLIREVAGFRRCLADELLLTGVGRVAIDPALVAVQQLRDQMLVMHVGRRGHRRVDQLCLAIHADVGLHAKMPLIALLGLAHLGIALPILVLGRGRRVDDRRIDDGAGAHLQAIRLKMPADFLEQTLAQIMSFEQVAELADGGLVRGAFPSQDNANEVAHRQRVVERFLDRRV